MKDIKLNMTVKYTVRVTMSVPDDVFESIEHMEDKYPFGFDTNLVDRKCEAATDFFADNISEKDACDWEYMINDLEEIKDDES